MIPKQRTLVQTKCVDLAARQIPGCANQVSCVHPEGGPHCPGLEDWEELKPRMQFFKRGEFLVSGPKPPEA